LLGAWAPSSPTLGPFPFWAVGTVPMVWWGLPSSRPQFNGWVAAGARFPRGETIFGDPIPEIAGRLPLPVGNSLRESPARFLFRRLAGREQNAFQPRRRGRRIPGTGERCARLRSGKKPPFPRPETWFFGPQNQTRPGPSGQDWGPCPAGLRKREGEGELMPLPGRPPGPITGPLRNLGALVPRPDPPLTTTQPVSRPAFLELQTRDFEKPVRLA